MRAGATDIHDEFGLNSDLFISCIAYTRYENYHLLTLWIIRYLVVRFFLPFQGTVKRFEGFVECVVKFIHDQVLKSPTGGQRNRRLAVCKSQTSHGHRCGPCRYPVSRHVSCPLTSAFPWHLPDITSIIKRSTLQLPPVSTFRYSTRIYIIMAERWWNFVTWRGNWFTTALTPVKCTSGWHCVGSERFMARCKHGGQSMWLSREPTD